MKALYNFDVSNYVFIAVVALGSYLAFFLYVLFLSWINRRRLVKTSKRFYEEKHALLEMVRDGVITMNKGRRITYINERAFRFFSLAPIFKPNMAFSRLKRSKNRRLWEICSDAIEQAIQTGKESTASLDNFGVAGLYLKINVRMTPGEKDLVVTLQDESDQQKILDMGKEFIANASHELKTPVTIIKGFAETLKDLPEVSEDMFETILEKIIRNCERMEKLVKHLLRITDLEQSDLSGAKKCNLVMLVEHCFHNLLSVHPDVRIELLTNRDQVLVWGSSDLLELAFTNIFKNAVKYSNPPVTVVVRIKVEEESVLLQVIDKGIGIPQKDLDRIFDRFYTVDKARCRKLGGAGLGLSIVKIIIEKHGGKIWATSEERKGSTFHIKLPLIDQPAPKREPIQKSPSAHAAH